MSGSHEHEPIRGLPELLPEGERILWQGAPSWPSLARNALHINKVAAYFSLLLAWRLISLFTETAAPPAQALAAALWPLPLAFIVLGFIALFAWLIERTTVYTLTNRRIVMRIGVALSMTMNFPFRVIASADLVTFANGTGNLPFRLGSADHVAYLTLWPHARPWRFAKSEPMLRCIPNAAHVAALLAEALREYHSAHPASAATTSPSNAPVVPPLASSL
ncbi:PH domain-containing protein [Rhodocyclus tenuis]|uniref:PH domain-containing protein n=1 Tax=Rhodocyclus gracilis TaxID=2929842 RepID=A0ABX0WKH3_9RHOO|nr:photosynthetic complex putative assembly protein PuhB [Rhodocyclus gracilis]NJA90224.1 PH domain-containing protein [Rhodocyclus gracilis]